tara:strand:+ start:98 stop:652 length:555 start_codon:yes stop_codon:yes gene_type:complete
MKKPMMKKDMTYKKMAYKKEISYKKDMTYKMRTNQDGGSYSAENTGAPAKELMKNQMTKKMDPMMKYDNGPMLKSRQKVEQDYARNAIADYKAGDKKAANYEKKKALEVAAGEGMTKKGMPMHKDGSMKGDQSATRVDYSMDKGGTDKGYKGKTGSSKGDQSASKADYAMKKMGRPGIYKHMKS